MKGDQISSSINASDVIPAIVTSEVNEDLETFTTEEEILKAIQDLNEDVARGPDGFGGFFYKKC